MKSISLLLSKTSTLCQNFGRDARDKFSCRIFIVFDKIEQLTIFTPFPNGISQKTHFLLKMTKMDTFLTTSIFVIFTHTILFGVVSGNKNTFSQISRECYFFDKILRHPKKNRMCVIVFFDV